MDEDLYCGIVQLRDGSNIKTRVFKINEYDSYFESANSSKECGREIRCYWNSAMGGLSREILEIFIDFHRFIGAGRN